MTKLNFAYIGVGTNLGNKLQNIKNAYQHIHSKCGVIVRKSSIYSSPPWGFEAKEDFYNTVILIKTKSSAKELLKQLKQIELKLGRDLTPKNQYESRIIDLDIIDYNGIEMDEDDLVIPHLHLEKRSFVAIPLQEICTDWSHPKTKIKIQKIINTIEDRNELQRLEF